MVTVLSYGAHAIQADETSFKVIKDKQIFWHVVTVYILREYEHLVSCMDTQYNGKELTSYHHTNV